MTCVDVDVDLDLDGDLNLDVDAPHPAHAVASRGPSWQSSAVPPTELLDPVAVARTWVRTLREQEKCDVVVVLIHSGLEADPQPGEQPVHPPRCRRPHPARRRLRRHRE